TIFRRLYMVNEQADFKKAVAIFTNAVGDCPHGRWVGGVFDEYSKRLSSVPMMHPMIPPGSFTDEFKRLIDVFVYTQYAHQPSEQRQKQFKKCLSQVNGKLDV